MYHHEGTKDTKVFVGCATRTGRSRNISRKARKGRKEKKLISELGVLGALGARPIRIGGWIRNGASG